MKLLLMRFVFFPSKLTQTTDQTLTQLHMDVIFGVLQFNTFVPPLYEKSLCQNHRNHQIYQEHISK